PRRRGYARGRGRCRRPGLRGVLGLAAGAARRRAAPDRGGPAVSAGRVGAPLPGDEDAAGRRSHVRVGLGAGPALPRPPAGGVRDAGIGGSDETRTGGVRCRYEAAHEAPYLRNEVAQMADEPQDWKRLAEEYAAALREAEVRLAVAESQRE